MNIIVIDFEAGTYHIMVRQPGNGYISTGHSFETLEELHDRLDPGQAVYNRTDKSYYCILKGAS